MRRLVFISMIAALGLNLQACHSSNGDSITNLSADSNGTASDAMTNIDATVGSSAAMPADQGQGAEKDSADKSDDSKNASAKAEGGNNP